MSTLVCTGVAVPAVNTAYAMAVTGSTFDFISADGSPKFQLIATRLDDTPRSPPSEIEVSLPAAVVIGNARQGFVEERGLVVGGVPQAYSNFDTLYNRIHVSPLVIELGNIPALTLKEVKVWSAFLTPNELVSFPATGGEGIAWDFGGGDVVPFTFDALEQRSVIVAVGLDGPPTVDAGFTFNFANGNRPTVTITGQRVVFFTWPHNWQSSIKESYEFKTDIMTSMSGNEQRRACRQVPKVFMAMDYLNHDVHQSNKMQNILYGWMNRSFSIPLWNWTTNLAADLAAGAVAIPTPTDGYPYKEKGTVALWVGVEDFEVCQIDTIGSGVLNLVRPVIADWPKGTRVMPIVTGVAAKEVGAKKPTSKSVKSPVVWELAHECYDQMMGAPATATTYKGQTLQMGRVNRAEDMDYSFAREGREVVDYGSGARIRDDFRQYTDVEFSAEWWLRNRGEISAFKQFLATRKGKCRRFFMPTWNHDLTVVADIPINSSALKCKNIGYVKYLLGASLLNDLVVFFRDGTYQIKSITGANDNGDGTETITVNSVFNVSAVTKKENIVMVSYLPCVRLTSDITELEYVTSTFAKYKAKVRVVRNT